MRIVFDLQGLSPFTRRVSAVPRKGDVINHMGTVFIVTRVFHFVNDDKIVILGREVETDGDMI